MRTLSRMLARFRVPEAAERMSPPLLQERKTWIVITVFWTVAGVGSWLLEYDLSFESPDGPMTLARAAARLVYAALWLGVTVAAIGISDTFTVRHPRQYLRITFHLLIGLVIAVGWAVLAYYVSLAVIPGWLPLGVARMVNTTFLTSYFYYVGMVALVHGIIVAREHHAREINALQEARAAAHAQFQILKMELQPHFLFNTLHAISALMHRDVKAANEMLVLLADMLDAALHSVRDQEVTLQEELETLKLYMQIQQIRFGERLQVRYAIDSDALPARVPHMIFQPLVENAIKHGIADRAAGGRVEISARISDHHLELAVQDNGRGLRTARLGHGLGLTNTRERLGYLYGERQRFDLRDLPGGGVRATVSIPLITGEKQNPDG